MPPGKEDRSPNRRSPSKETAAEEHEAAVAGDGGGSSRQPSLDEEWSGLAGELKAPREPQSQRLSRWEANSPKPKP